MIKRVAVINVSKLPPNRYIVAQSCPKLLEGHAFHACALFHPGVASQDKPALSVTCEHLVGQPRFGERANDAFEIFCTHGVDQKQLGNGAQFGVPTISHYQREVNDGSDPD